MNTELFGNYGKCVKFKRGELKVLITLDIGPRIIWFGTENFNFFNSDLERNVNKGGEYFDRNFGDGTKWYLYGGHRVWKSPEDLETYVPDNVPVEAEIRECGGTFTCKAAKNFDYTLDVELDADEQLVVRNIIKNKSDEEREVAVWGLSVMTKGGTIILPANDPVDDLNPVQNLVHWPYNHPDDERLSYDHKNIALRWANIEDAIKIGTFTSKGVAYYVIDGKEMKWECIPEKGAYGDFWCNFESYTNSHILEVEWLSPLRKIKSGEESVMIEKWSITAPPVSPRAPS